MPGRSTASSAYTNAPISAISPPISQAPRIRNGVCTCRATTDGLTKIPAPMIPPITIMVASKGPSRRARDGSFSLEFNPSLQQIVGRFAIRHAPWNRITLQMQFEDRAEAGRFLAEALQSYRGRKDVIVLALPRGGVPVGYEVARSLGAPLDVFVVRKLGVPGYSELAMGAIASGGIRVLNEDVVAALGPKAQEAIELVAEAELAELHSREKRY